MTINMLSTHICSYIILYACTLSIVDKNMENTRVLKVGMGQAVLRILFSYVADFIPIYNLCLYVP